MPLFIVMALLIFSTQASALGMLDRSGRDFFAKESYGARETAHELSNLSLTAALLMPAALLYQKGQWRDLTPFLVTGAGVLLSKNNIARDRPYVPSCDTHPNYDPHCFQADSRKSFYSGHTAFAFTGAGVTCRWAKTYEASPWACPSALGLATFTGAARMTADKHFLSDVLVGGVLGYLSGYYLTFSF